jgi:type VI secretion system protein ImpJ
MTENNRIVWSEGLFLRPQHFQQQERFLETYVEGRAAAFRGQSWGFVELEIERDLLAIGKLGLRRARGIFPDGTPFAMPDNDPLPAPLEIGTQMRDQVIHLALAVRGSAPMLAGRDGDGGSGLARYRSRDYEARDAVSNSGEPADLQVAALNARLVPDDDPAADFARIPLAHVVECRADGQVVLDDGFIPTVLTCSVAGRLQTFLAELQGLLRQRGDALAERALATGRGGAAEIADFLMLQAINRYEPVIIHLAAKGDCHPDELYRLALEMAGELSTLASAARRPPPLPAYRHNALRLTFEPLIRVLRSLLSVVLERNAIPILLEPKKFGISLATVSDRTLFDNAVFVLAARADLPVEDLRGRFPLQLKVGSAEKIRDLVNLQLPGVGVQAMAVAPRQIPYHAGFVYFELDRTGELWKALKSSGVIALHQAGELPGLVMELWAIRS